MSRLTVLTSITVLMSLFTISSAWSRTFHKATLKMKLTYSQASSKTKTLGKAKAKVVMSDDRSYCQMTIEKLTLDCEASFDSAKRYSVRLTEKNVQAILREVFSVSEETVAQMSPPMGATFFRNYTRYSGHERKTSIQLHTSNVAESYHLEVTARQAWKR